MPVRILIALALFLPSTALAASAPSLKDQKAWSEKEKDQLIEYIRSGAQPSMAGQVKQTVSADERQTEARRPWYVSASVVTDSMLTVGGNGSLEREGSSLGPKLLVGGHLFSWVRFYGGAQLNRFKARRSDGGREAINHWQIPVGVELALVPLGTPQTRYIVLRGGLSWHHFTSSSPKEEFRNSLSGWNGAWNAGLGYEWQFSNSNWRVNVMAEGYSYLWRQNDTVRFYGIGATAGLAYTF